MGRRLWSRLIRCIRKMIVDWAKFHRRDWLHHVNGRTTMTATALEHHKQQSFATFLLWIWALLSYLWIIPAAQALGPSQSEQWGQALTRDSLEFIRPSDNTRNEDDDENSIEEVDVAIGSWDCVWPWVCPHPKHHQRQQARIFLWCLIDSTNALQPYAPTVKGCSVWNLMDKPA